jgi:hypothetical protein
MPPPAQETQKRHGSNKRRVRQVSGYLMPEEFAEVERMRGTGENRLNRGKVVSKLIRMGLAVALDQQYASMLEPRIEQTLNRLDVRKIARETMKYLQRIDPTIEFIVAEHNDHSDIPHVQGLVFVNGWISRDDLIEMGKIALQEALTQRKSLDRGIDLVPLLQQSVQRSLQNSRSTERPLAPLSPLYQPVGMAGGRASARKSLRASAGLHKAREPTLACPNGMSHKVVKWRGKDFCTVDKKVLEQSMGLEL